MKPKIRLYLPLMLLLLPSCQQVVEPAVQTPNAKVPAIMLDHLYVMTDQVLAINPDEADYSCKTTAVVSLSIWPEKLGEANFEPLGTPYLLRGDGIAVLWGEEWVLFERHVSQ